MTIGILIAGVTITILGVVLGSRGRESSEPEFDEAAVPSGRASANRPPNTIAGWLGRAGFRGRAATAKFAFVQLVALGLGIFVGVLFARSESSQLMVRYLDETPGGLGLFFVPIAHLAPILMGLLVASIPAVAVRRARRTLIRDVDRNLPVVLELLATLGQAGLGFDAALARLLATGEVQETHLGRELARFDREVRSGVPRIRALRELARRNEVPSLTLCTSALIQAQVQGAAIAEFLRQQAIDVQARMRERALIAAQSLPAKLAFPLVLCFLPGLLLLTLGPALAQFSRILTGVTP